MCQSQRIDRSTDQGQMMRTPNALTCVCRVFATTPTLMIPRQALLHGGDSGKVVKIWTYDQAEEL